MNIFDFFTDPILRAPTIGSMLMCMASALIGVIVYLRKESLVAEALSHATYPGVMGGVVASALLGATDETSALLSPLILTGALVAATLAYLTLHILKNRLNVSSDTALCFVLATFFGVGVLFASAIQFSYSRLYNTSQAFLFGQAATMTDVHIWTYTLLCASILLLLLLLYKEIQIITFDPAYAKTLGIPTGKIYPFLFLALVLAIVIGIRSVGVVLLSGMFIAPSIAARQWSHHLGTVFILSALIGLFSGWLGNVLSLYLSDVWHHLSLPTGPMIILIAATICVASLLFAPERGIVPRLWRSTLFRYRCLSENILKTIWRGQREKGCTFDQIADFLSISPLYLHFLLFQLTKQRWITHRDATYRLTPEGNARATKIVRLHRLWELYLATYIGIGEERVHLHAEEMEHVLTPAVEEELARLLHNPTEDPHHQPIPPKTSWT